jgi:hypothetical protein
MWSTILRQVHVVANTSVYYSSGTPVCDWPVTRGGIPLSEAIMWMNRIGAHKKVPAIVVLLSGLPTAASADLPVIQRGTKDEYIQLASKPSWAYHVSRHYPRICLE